MVSQRGFRAQPLFWLGLAAVVGIFLAEAFPLGVFAYGLLAAVLGRIFLSYPRPVMACLFLGAVFSLSTSIHDHRARQLPDYARLAAGGGLPVEATGRVNQLLPSRETPSGGFSTTVRLESLRTSEGLVRCRLKVRLMGSRELTRPSYGDEVRITGYLQLPKSARNPGQFDSRVHLRSRGVLAEILADRDNNEILVTGNSGWPPFLAAVRARTWLAEAVTRDLDDEPNTQALLQAMALGAKEEAPGWMIDDFRYSGTLHVFAVSGLHVGLVGMILWAILVPLRIPRKGIIVIVAVLLVVYTCVTGLRPSAVRATTMALVVLGALLLDRQPRLLNSLGAAALLLLAWEPFRLLDLGFQLSFGVLLAIAILVPVFRRFLQPRCQPDPFIPQQLVTESQRRRSQHLLKLADVGSVSLAAWIGSTPLNLFYFSLITPIAIVVNPFVLFLTSGILFAALLSAILSALPGLGLLSILLNNANHFLGSTVLALVGGAASVPGGHMQVAVPEWPPWEKKLHVDVLDLGRGGASQLVQVPGQDGWLIDSGDEDRFRSTTLAFLKTRGILKLDGLIQTHSDMRHTGGAEQLTSSVQVDRILGPPMAEQRAEIVPATRTGLEIPLTESGEGTITVLFPPKGEIAWRTDDRCLVLLLEWKNWRILFKSDAGFITEKYLLEHHREELRADLLVTGRHNSDYSLLEEFVLAVDPRAVIATDAPYPPEQKFPFEKKAMLERLEIPLFLSSETGAMRIRATEEELSLRGYLEGTARFQR